jgi:transcriptional regulator NrdR family protein
MKSIDASSSVPADGRVHLLLRPRRRCKNCSGRSTHDDFADASLVVAAEPLSTRKIFTIDRKDFDVYRIQRGHRKVSFERLEVLAMTYPPLGNRPLSRPRV